MFWWFGNKSYIVLREKHRFYLDFFFFFFEETLSFFLFLDSQSKLHENVVYVPNVVPGDNRDTKPLSLIRGVLQHQNP